MDGARDFAGRGIRAAPRLQQTALAIQLAGAIARRVVFHHAGSWHAELPAVTPKDLSCRTAIGVSEVIVGEVVAREGAVRALRFVEDRNVRLDTALMDQPSEVLGLSGISCAAERVN